MVHLNAGIEFQDKRIKLLNTLLNEFPDKPINSDGICSCFLPTKQPKLLICGDFNEDLFKDQMVLKTLTDFGFKKDEERVQTAITVDKMRGSMQ